ncbi:hypothetical protein ElyMa_005775700 [Elysia marginata]|uniref:Secreted protein n=1 Tax=Elysia marginata TaxID=1093978 RepID=A0AAV4FPX3_9GAST|nr:hypothetical protein ElyMa_005775700 [Elysia marginata]
MSTHLVVSVLLWSSSGPVWYLVTRACPLQNSTLLYSDDQTMTKWTRASSQKQNSISLTTRWCDYPRYPPDRESHESSRAALSLTDQ